MFGALLGVGGSIGAAAIGAGAQDSANKTNYAIALMNYYQRERERFETMQEARRVEGKNDKGFTDGQGTKTSYKPGVGWVVDVAPQVAGLQNREMSERMQALSTDAGVKRRGLLRNESRQLEEDDYSKALLAAIKGRQERTPQQLEGLLLQASTQGLNRGFDDAQEMAMKQAMRTNASNSGEILKSFARERADAQATAGVNARKEAMMLAPQLNAAETKTNSDLYNLFATRAAAQPDVSFAPSNIDTNANANLLAAGKLSASNGELAVKAAGKEGGTMAYQPPNFGTANLVGAMGSSLGAMFRNQSAVSEGGFESSLMNALRGRERTNQGAS